MSNRLSILRIADFRVACIAVFILEFSAMMVIPIIPLYSKTLGASVTLIGSMFAGYAIGRMVSLVPGGYISDRKGDVTVAGVATLCSALPPYLITLLLNPQHFIVLRTIEGIFIGMAGPAFYSIVNRSIKPEQRGLAMGIYLFSAMSGAALAPLLSGYLASAFSMKYPFYLSAFLSACGGVMVFLLIKLPKLEKPSSERRFSLRQEFGPFIKTSKGFFLVGIAAISFFGEFIWGMVQAVVPLFVQEILEVGIQDVALVFTFNFTIILVSQPFMGHLADKYGGKKQLALVSVIMIACVSSLGIAQTFWQFLAIYSLECLVGAAIMPTTRKMVGELYSDRELTGKAFGIFLTLSGLGSILGPIVCSFFYQAVNPRFVFGVVGIVGLLCLGIYLFAGIIMGSRPEDQTKS